MSNIKSDIMNQLLDTLQKINTNLSNTESYEENAILLLAKSNTLAALQKYEGENK